MDGQESLAILQRFVDHYADDLVTVQSALADSSTPEAARRPLVGGLNYALDMLDMFPDHMKGLGVADDALVLRLSAKMAVAAGAAHPALGQLAGEAGDVASLFGELTPALEKFVAKLPERTVRGRTTDQILKDKDARTLFDADVTREAKRYKPQQIDVSAGGPERALIELRKMAQHSLKKAGVL
jgi:uncharacterized membrane protein YkvA (DUF1232 family)